jgi:serine/threonine protein kinase
MSGFELQKFGKYLLVDKIAQGGMAELYRAKLIREEGFEKLIAIKKILSHLAKEDALVSSFIDEAKLAALLQHQNIVQIYDFGDVAGFYFIAMEYLYGKDLKQIIIRSKDRKTPISLENALYITSQICAGLDYAYKLKDFQRNPLNIIHRDIGPQNIIITYDGQVKIIDFGIAKAAIQDATTQEYSIKGKIAYMSPEQALGEEIDHRSDIFAIGILLYEMVTRRRMFEGDASQVFAKVRGADFTPAREVNARLPVEIYDILDKALAKERKERYQSAEEFLSDLEGCIYSLSFRPSARNLSRYIKALFREEADAEYNAMREVARIDSSKVLGDSPATPPSAEKTVVLTENEIPQQRRRPVFRYATLIMILAIAVITAIITYVEDPASLFREIRKPISIKDRAILASNDNNLNPAATEEGKKTITSTESPKPIGNPWAIMSAPEPPWLKEGNALLNKEQYAEAVVLFEETLASKPSSSDEIYILYSLALAGLASRISKTDPEKAKALLLKSVRLVPGYAHAHYLLGRIYTEQKDFTSAVASYQAAAELDPQMPEVYFNLGYIYATRKDYNRAYEMFKRVVDLSPPFLDEALYNLALVQIKLNKPRSSIDNLEQAIRINPKNVKAKRLLDRLRRKEGKKGSQ